MADEHENGWIGVDLDGTLAYDSGVWAGPGAIGAPIIQMVLRVKLWLRDGYEVRIVTARLDNPDRDRVIRDIQTWCIEHIGRSLPVTDKKDARMLELWDDRAVQVEHNTGKRVGSVSTRGLVKRPRT